MPKPCVHPPTFAQTSSSPPAAYCSSDLEPVPLSHPFPTFALHGRPDRSSPPPHLSSLFFLLPPPMASHLSLNNILFSSSDLLPSPRRPCYFPYREASLRDDRSLQVPPDGLRFGASSFDPQVQVGEDRWWGASRAVWNDRGLSRS
jgi:hypothetical protein